MQAPALALGKCHCTTRKPPRIPTYPLPARSRWKRAREVVSVWRHVEVEPKRRELVLEMEGGIVYIAMLLWEFDGSLRYEQ